MCSIFGKFTSYVILIDGKPRLMFSGCSFKCFYSLFQFTDRAVPIIPSVVLQIGSPEVQFNGSVLKN